MVAVHVLIDLHWKNAIGGHVKSWLQFAKVAEKLDELEIDLTLHFQGNCLEAIVKSKNVRYITHKPRFSTEKLPFLHDVPSHTDLASYAPSLIPFLKKADVIHATHPLFTFGQTARKFCERTNKPLVSSIHTDSPQYAEVYLQEKITKVLGQKRVRQFLIQNLKLPARYKHSLELKQVSYWGICKHVLYSQPRERDDLISQYPHLSISRLRRGLDLVMFSPVQRNRLQLYKLYNIPINAFLLLFVGRLDACKNVLTFAKIAKTLAQQGFNIHAIAVGRGAQAREIKEIADKSITLLGVIPQEQLGLIYASCDLLVFPSETETVGNVVLEAKASGLIPLVSDKGGVTQLIQESGLDGVIIQGQDPETWAKEIISLYTDSNRREKMHKTTAKQVRERWPTWETVFVEDLLPIWQGLG